MHKDSGFSRESLVTVESARKALSIAIIDAGLYRVGHDDLALANEMRAEEEGALNDLMYNITVRDEALAHAENYISNILGLICPDFLAEVATEASFACIDFGAKAKQRVEVMPPVHAAIGEYRDGDTPTNAPDPTAVLALWEAWEARHHAGNDQELDAANDDMNEAGEALRPWVEAQRSALDTRTPVR